MNASNNNKTGKTPNDVKSPALSTELNIPITVTLKKSVFDRISKYKKDCGAFSEAEVIRTAISAFLNKTGY